MSEFSKRLMAQVQGMNQDMQQALRSDSPVIDTNEVRLAAGQFLSDARAEGKLERMNAIETWLLESALWDLCLALDLAQQRITELEDRIGAPRRAPEVEGA